MGSPEKPGMSINQGWISLHRKLLDWEWYTDSKVVHLFVHCLLKANHKPAKWRGIEIDAGQFISSQQHLAEQTKLSLRQVRTALDKLKMTGELTVKTTNKYSIISITNWKNYQVDDMQTVSEAAVKRQSNDNQMTTNNNDNNKNNVNKRFKQPTVQEVQQYINEKGYTFNAEQFIDHYQAKGWMIGNSKMKDWKAACRTWSKYETNKPRRNLTAVERVEAACRKSESNNQQDDLPALGAHDSDIWP